MRKMWFIVVIFMMFSVIAQVRADDKIHLDYDTKTQIRVPTPVKIKRAIDGQTLLSDDGKIYALTGLDLTDTAYKRLTELTEGKNCTLYQTRNDKVGRINRQNQILGQFTCDKDDVWVQGTLLAEGLARVRTTPENNQQATAMLKLESAARSKKSGLWALPVNAVLTPDSAKKHTDSFAIVEGTVYATAQNRESIFLNFTSDWKTDFSIGIPAKLRRDFAKLQIDPMSLKGQTVRVRGWMRDYNGPYIELDHANQLEMISSSSPSPLTGEGRGEGENNYKTTNTDKQFMHTIGGPKTPTIEKPTVEKPKPPIVDTKQVDKNQDDKTN